MTGCIKYIKKRGRAQAAEECICGLNILTLTFHDGERGTERTLERSLSRTERTLCRAGVTRIILPVNFPYTARFERFNPVKPVEFYRAAADVLALGWLRIHGLDIGRSRVTLTGHRLCPEMKNAARRLCRCVKELCINIPGEDGTAFADLLQSECGVPVVPCGVPADLTVEFGPTSRPAQLRLWGERPNLDGLTLRARGVVPPEEIALPVLALLWERGRVRREQLEVVSEKMSKK